MPQPTDSPGDLKPLDVLRKQEEQRADATFDRAHGQPPPSRAPHPGEEAELPPDSFARSREDVPPSLSTPSPKLSR